MGKILFSYRSSEIKVFYYKTFRNILDFWRKIDI